MGGPDVGTHDIRTVGLVGLGDQGAPIAEAVARSAFDLVVWARRPASLDVLKGEPHAVAGSVEELGRADLVALCLRDDDDFEAVAFEQGLLAAMQPGSILVNHATGSPDRCAAWTQRCRQAGVELLDAPVSGGPAGARDRTLAVLVGGDASALTRARPVFDTYAGSVNHLGPPGAGQLVKLVNNAMLAANLRTAGAVVELAAALGLDIRRTVDVLKVSSAGFFPFDVLTDYIGADLAPHSTAVIGKDVEHLAETARARGYDPTELERWASEGVVGISEAIDRLDGSD